VLRESNEKKQGKAKRRGTNSRFGDGKEATRRALGNKDRQRKGRRGKVLYEIKLNY